MDVRLREVERLHGGLLAGAVCAAIASGWLSAPSLFLGGAVMGANLWLMRQLARRMFASTTPRRATMVALVVAKFAIFMLLLGLLFWRAPIDALAFGVGTTLLPLACVGAALRPTRGAVPT
jgi:hypothetical protein